MAITFSYRMTETEYGRYLTERTDPTPSESAVNDAIDLIRTFPGKRLAGGTDGTVLYDAGENFYWVRTARPVDWM